MKARETPGRGPQAVGEHRRLLTEWLQEWRLERLLASGDEEPVPPPAIRYRAAAVDEPPIRAGDVRLLKPEDKFSAARPRYFLVLRLSDDEQRIVIVPFGRFTTPAFPGEWRTGRRVLPLAVLCAWNAREVPRTRIRRSWRVDRFTKPQIASVEKLIATCAYPDAEPPPELADGVGPPLIAADDPRWDYLREEAEAWDAIEDEAVQIPAKPSPPWLLHEGGPPAETMPGALPLAAESPPSYQAKPPGRHRARRRRQDHNPS